MPFVVLCVYVQGNKKMGGNFHSPFYLGRKIRHGRYKISVEEEEKNLWCNKFSKLIIFFLRTYFKS